MMNTLDIIDLNGVHLLQQTIKIMLSMQEKDYIKALTVLLNHWLQQMPLTKTLPKRSYR